MNYSNLISSSFFAIILLFLSFQSTAQDGQYDVRFNSNSVDCDNGRVLIDIDIRSNNPNSTFYLSDQNYRFSHTKSTVQTGSVEIYNQELVGIVGTSLYNPHSLNGSLDSVLSYNVVLAGGPGVLVTESWRNIGTISLDALNFDVNGDLCIDLIWHPHAVFPPTFIGEKVSNQLYSTDEGNYYNLSVCIEKPCIIQPVELLSFTGNATNCNVQLDWVTETEIDNDYFKIEKSTDGREFSEIGKVKGQGNSTTLRTYTFTDEAALPVAYYRLIQVDFDGTTSIYKAITVKSDCYDTEIDNGITALFPNPVVTGDVSIKFYTMTDQDNAEIIVSDVLGREILKVPAPISAGPNTLSFPTESLAQGAYFVKVRNGNWFTKAQQFVKVGE